MQQEAEAPSEWKGVPRQQIIDEVGRLRETVRRLLRQPSPTPGTGHGWHPDDFVPAGWAERHGVSVPRADGIFESPEAWVRLKHGVIVGAGLKSQSILSLAVSLGKLDQGAEFHANLYRDWRAAFFSRLDPTRSGGKGSDSPEAWSKEDRYSKLLHRIDQDHIAAMDGIVAEKPKARHLAAFHGKKNATKEEIDKAQAAFVQAFHTVVSAMVEINREADDARERVKGQ